MCVRLCAYVCAAASKPQQQSTIVAALQASASSVISFTLFAFLFFTLTNTNSHRNAHKIHARACASDGGVAALFGRVYRQRAIRGT
jgi:hypothetical protein